MPDSVPRLAASFPNLSLASTLLVLAATDAVLLFSRRVQQARGVVDVFHSLHADVWPIEINLRLAFGAAPNTVAVIKYRLIDQFFVPMDNALER